MADYLPDDKKPAERLTLMDRAVSYFKGPTEKLIRMRAREIEHQFSYGYQDRPERRERSGGMFAHASAETWKTNRDRIAAMWDARDLVQFEFIGGMVARIMLYVCGKIHCQSQTGEAQINQIYDDYYHGWCGDEPGDDGLVRCDITGRHRHLKQVQMAFWGFLVDGDHGLLEVDPQISPNGEFCLQSIEADRIGSPLESQVQENYIGGISLDPETGRISSYRIFHRTRTNQYLAPQEKDPAAFIHVFDTERPDEYRGRSKFTRLLNHARDIREWTEAELITGKTQSQWAALVGVKDPFNQAKSGAMAWDNRTKEGTPTQNAEYGKILKMAEGEVFSMLSPPSRPTGSFMAFVEFVLRKMAVSLDLPYGFLWDLATLGGVTARIEVQQALRRIEYWQNQILVGQILNRVRAKVIAQGISLGILPPHPLWRKCSWHFGLSIQTDVGYEAEADIGMVNASLVPIKDVAGKYGYSPREVFMANATTAQEAIEVGAELGVPVEGFAKGLYPDLTLQIANMKTGPLPEPEPGSIEALGDKGVKLLVDYLVKVGEGKIDPDSARNVLKRTFDIPEAIAKKMIPDEPTPAKMKLLNPPAASSNATKAKVSKSQPKKKK